MLTSNLESKINFYNQDRFLEDPYSVNGFRGTWQFSDHSLIPDVFHGFIQRHFEQYKIRRVPLEQINKILNELWDGPGSLEKIFRLEAEYISSNKPVKFTAADIASIKAKKDSDEEDDLPLPDLDLPNFDDEDYTDD